MSIRQHQWTKRHDSILGERYLYVVSVRSEVDLFEALAFDRDGQLLDPLIGSWGITAADVPWPNLSEDELPWIKSKKLRIFKTITFPSIPGRSVVCMEDIIGITLGEGADSRGTIRLKNGTFIDAEADIMKKIYDFWMDRLAGKVTRIEHDPGGKQDLPSMIFVIMQNDWPLCYFEDKNEAERARAALDAGSEERRKAAKARGDRLLPRIYYRVEEVPAGSASGR